MMSCHDSSSLRCCCCCFSKATKSSKQGKSEKDRKRKEHAARVLNQQNKQKKPRISDEAAPSESSKFEALFKERSQGFEMEFAFRNAPPRPPVGPCFVGLGLDGQLQESSQYHPTVELNYTWKLHSEPDLGVPLAPSAMDALCYQQQNTPKAKLHADDEALLNWTGPMGDTAAEELKLKRDQARAAARLALKGKTLPTVATPTLTQPKKKKEFSRVLDENMQSWMKKTTYLANDYSRKVHDFTSLAKTKQKTEKDLEEKQARMDEHRSANMVSKTFQQTPIVKHPSKPHLKPVSELPLLPNAQHWGQAYTHVVLDNPPKGEDAASLQEPLDHAFVAHVEKQQANARMTCQLLVPSSQQDDEYRPMQQYDLDVVPLKEEDAPHVHFAVWVGEDNTATYLPVSSRVSLSTGRPVKTRTTNEISRRPASQEEKRAFQERTSEVDADVAKALEEAPAANDDDADKNKSAPSYNPMEVDNNSSSDDEPQAAEGTSLGAGTTSTTIAAEG